jgi:bile acid:Na+ symporter, BASS family
MDVKTIIPWVVQLSLMLIVASTGLQSRWRDLEYALQHPRLLLKAIVAVNVVVPIVAVLAVLALPVIPAVKAGIVIMAVSPLAPFAPGKMLKTGADSSVAVGLYFALILLAVLIVPATFALLSAIFPRDATIPVRTVAWFVWISVLVPLIAGLLIAEFVPNQARRLAKIANLVGMLLLLPLAAGILYLAGGQILALVGNGTLAAITLVAAAALAAGHLLGGPDQANRMALATAAVTRHPGIAGLVAARHFHDRRVMLSVVLFLLVSVIISSLYQAWAKRGLRDESVLRPRIRPHDAKP